MKQSFGEKLKALFSKGNSINEEFFEELTDMLVEGDIGAKTAFDIWYEWDKGIYSDDEVFAQMLNYAKKHDTRESNIF